MKRDAVARTLDVFIRLIMYFLVETENGTENIQTC